ncbi:MAG TPA: SAM-dependent methyltransferase [Spongiibacteraceae bacterium]|nr:SAM-dependent methyltransferase [Spongiibacteraceae bacterium]HCS29391.1 SAM-dependent methyltransferase [Spongiibacteraceae bacterium]
MKICLSCTKNFSSPGWDCPVCGYAPSRLNGVEAHAPEFANGGGGFKSEYFSELATLESNNFWFRARNELILWALRTYKPGAHNFLEVGCGTGFVLAGIAESHPETALSGSEIFLAGLSHAATRVPLAKFMQMDARHVPYADEFDAIGAFDVLEHIKEDEAVLAQLYRALNPEGVLLLTVPQHPWLWSASDEYACHVRRYTNFEIEEKIRGAGFKVLRSTSFVTTLLPAMMLSRSAQGKANKAIDPAGELKINPLLNTTFYTLMMLELAGIKLGLNYPVGGSRLIVATKIE